MTFSEKVKAELCSTMPIGKSCSVALCYGLLLYCRTFTSGEIRLVSGNDNLAHYLPRVFRKAFGFSFDSVSEKKGPAAKRSFLITTPEKLNTILDQFGYDASRMMGHHVNFAILEEDCCKTAFIKGAFLAGGTVSAPESRYHLEFSTIHASVSRETAALLRELGSEARESTRKGSHLLYYKKSEDIEELLSLIGATSASMDFMNAKIEKTMNNSVNRQVNCDAANVKKAVNAAMHQVQAIRRLQPEELPEALRETARLRLDNPSLTITELAALHNPPTSKSCVNHRLRRLMELARLEE